MKKALSLALALVMCMGLALPAFAEEAKAGDTTVAAENATYTLSNPITRVDAVPDSVRTLINEGSEGAVIEGVYVVPAGTILTSSNEEGIDYFASDGIGTSDKLEIEAGYYYPIWDAPFLVFFGDEEAVAEPPADSEPPAPESTDPEPTNPPDTPAYQVSNWAKDRVAVAVENGLNADSLGNDYRVNITRAQFAATAVKLYEAMSGGKAEATGESSFTDTDDAVILQAADLGFVSGVGGGKFDPEALVTREQAAVMLSSVYTKLGGEIPAVEATTFADDGDVAGWARNAVAFMNSKEIVTGVGDNNFSPKGNASIEQALLISLKMFETLK